MGATGQHTVTASRGQSAPAGGPLLTLVLEAHNPTAAPARFDLRGVLEIRFGRAAERRFVRDGGALRIELPDPLASGHHATITRVLGRLLIEDAGSKNGTLINGTARARAPLGDGDLFEIGQTLFLVREAAAPPRSPAIVDADGLTAPAPGLATLSPTLTAEFARLAGVARSEVSVVLAGETGTGKEVAARAVHALSGAAGAFVAVNCGALPAQLVESQLFGHKKGAFSGAVEDAPGLIRAAAGGTLFLDEIGDLPLPAQAALLRVLQEREVLPVGGTRPVPVSFRLISATHRPLAQLAEAGSFRADLLARIAGHRVELPPLRARREDLGLLVRDLLLRLAPAAASSVKLHPRAARALALHGWPGNIRELEKCLGAALALAGGERIALEHLPEAVRAPARPPEAAAGGLPGIGEEVEALERRRIETALEAAGGNQTRAAALIGMPLRTFQTRIKQYRLRAPGR